MSRLSAVLGYLRRPLPPDWESGLESRRERAVSRVVAAAWVTGLLLYALSVHPFDFR